jgi:hypothetical protein
MEARVTALEAAVGEILAELRAMRQDMATLTQGMTGLKQDVADLRATNHKIEIDLARMDGRVSQMPTLIQLVTVVIAIWGMAFATLRFAGVP